MSNKNENLGQQLTMSSSIVRRSFVAEKFYGRFLFQTGFTKRELTVLFTKVSTSTNITL